MPPVLIALVAFMSIALLVSASFTGSRGQVQARLRPYADPRESLDPVAAPFSTRMSQPIIHWLAHAVRSVSSRGFENDVRTQLAQAGNPAGLDVNRFLAMRAIGLVAPLAIYVGPHLLTGDLDLRTMVIGLVFAAIGWRAPTIWLGARTSARRKAITKSLPDALDLIIVCVEAGNSLEGALAIVSEKMSGPLAFELSRTLQEMSLGKMRSEALHDLAKRSGSPDLQTFVAAVVQADQLGIGIAQVLRVQGDAMRIKRRQRAEEAAAKVPVKMLLPLVLFILPALMIIIMGPVVLTVASFFAAHPT